MTDPAIAQLLKEVERLKDIEAIKRVKHRYFRCIDTANLAELAEIFDENVTAVLVGGSYRFEVTGRDHYLEMIANSFHADFVGRHNGHHPEIDILSDTEATGMWYLSDLAIDLRHNIATSGSALYKDRYVKKDGHWKILHSHYERVYEMVETLEKRPNLTAHYLATHGRKLP